MARLRRISDIQGEELEALHIDYEGNVIPIRELCPLYGIGPTTLNKMVTLHGWRRRSPRRVDPKDLIGRLLRLLDARVRELEAGMNKAGTIEVAELGKMVTSLDKLIIMRKAEAAAAPRPGRTREMSDIKARLIERIEQLKRR
jgi:hypothetical protein